MSEFKDEIRMDTARFKERTEKSIEEMKKDTAEMKRNWGELSNKMGTLGEDIIEPGTPDAIKKKV